MQGSPKLIFLGFKGVKGLGFRLLFGPIGDNSFQGPYKLLGGRGDIVCLRKYGKLARPKLHSHSA